MVLGRKLVWDDFAFREAFFNSMLILKLKRMPIAEELEDIEKLSFKTTHHGIYTCTGRTLVLKSRKFKGSLKSIAEEYKLEYEE